MITEDRTQHHVSFLQANQINRRNPERRNTSSEDKCHNPTVMCLMLPYSLYSKQFCSMTPEKVALQVSPVTMFLGVTEWHKEMPQCLFYTCSTILGTSSQKSHLIQWAVLQVSVSRIAVFNMHLLDCVQMLHINESPI